MADEQDVTAEAPREVQPWETVKEIDHRVESFMANGKKYRVAGSLSADRWETYELLTVEVGMARTFEDHQAGLREAYDDCNAVAAGQPRFANLAVKLRDMIMGSILVGERQLHPVLKLCALFINWEGEDVRYITEETIRIKVEDWKAEGIAMRYFFQFALHSIPGYVAAYKASTQGIYGKMEGEAMMDDLKTMKSGFSE